MNKIFIFIVATVVVAFVALVGMSFRDEPVALESAAQFSPEVLERTIEKFIGLVEKSDARIALDSLRDKASVDDALMRSCHPIAHAIGRSAFERYGFAKAMTYQDEVCNSGYQHGVIEAYFLSGVNVRLAMGLACSGVPARTFKAWECFHGVGHGLMYVTKNELPGSIELCERFTDDFERDSCVNGVMMENFNSDEMKHPSTYLNPEDTFFPCATQSDEYKPDCYMYSRTYYLSLHPDEYSEALAQCLSLDDEYKGACAEGVGSQAMKENMNHPEVAEAACISGPSQLARSCVRGMVGQYIFHRGSPEPAHALCRAMQSRHMSICQKTVAESAPLFEP